MIVYFNGEFMPKNEVKISPDDRGFLLGDGAYEVMRSYNGFLFKAREHILRMDQSLEKLRLMNPFKGDIKGIGESLSRITIFRIQTLPFISRLQGGQPLDNSLSRGKRFHQLSMLPYLPFSQHRIRISETKA